MPISMQDRKPLLSGLEVGAQSLRVDFVTFEYVIECGEQAIECADKFAAIIFCDLTQVADHPAHRFKFPFTGKAEESMIG